MKTINLIRISLLTSAVLSGACFANTMHHNAATHKTTEAHATNSDDAITKNIENKISKNKALDQLNIKVSTDKGEVTLKGETNTSAEKDQVVKIAHSVHGVKKVNTEDLKLKNEPKKNKKSDSNQVYSDSMITSKIKATFIKEKLFGKEQVASMTISVKTVDGDVELSGTAQNEAQIRNAVRLAKSVEGVKGVHSTVTVEKK